MPKLHAHWYRCMYLRKVHAAKKKRMVFSFNCVDKESPILTKMKESTFLKDSRQIMVRTLQHVLRMHQLKYFGWPFDSC